MRFWRHKLRRQLMVVGSWQHRTSSSQLDPSLYKSFLLSRQKLSGSRVEIRLRVSPRFPTLPANLEEHICCLYAFSPIPSTESNSYIPLSIALISAPFPQKKSAHWECLHRFCPNLDCPSFATCAPQEHVLLPTSNLRSDLQWRNGSNVHMAASLGEPINLL